MVIYDLFVKGEGLTILHKNLHPKGATTKARRSKCRDYIKWTMLIVFNHIAQISNIFF